MLQFRRVLGRSKVAPAIVILVLLTFWLLYGNEETIYGLSGSTYSHGAHRRPPTTLPEPETKEKLLREKQNQFNQEAKALEAAPGAGSIYGGTLSNLVYQDPGKLGSYASSTRPEASVNFITFTTQKPYVFNPYPYENDEWTSQHAQFVPCDGPAGRQPEDIRVFRGRPSNLPGPGFGSYDALGVTDGLCFEREARLGQYGFAPVTNEEGEQIDWESVSWGELQHQCRERNKARFRAKNPLNGYTLLGNGDPHEETVSDHARLELAASQPDIHKRDVHYQDASENGEARTALLLRSYTGKVYSDNDKQIIRSLITELSLRTGGEYEVFLFLHVKDDNTDIWASEEAYRHVVETQIPKEFWNITALWNTEKVKRTYPKLTPKALLVHNGQLSPVQIFMQEHREFDYVWNWEMDSRVIGHHYDILTKLGEFGRKQPRKGLWERNERFYIPSYHGDYDTEFRETVEQIYAGDTIWGAPGVPVVRAVGPKPPVSKPEKDKYEWGVGEEADLITLSPMFNPVNSNWILRNQVWGYRSRDMAWGDLPRRASVITQMRLSRKLVDIMHVENLRGNHLASEMVAPTVALIHGLKAVYAPMPVFFDLPWEGAQLAKWFNGGPKGDSGSFGSAMGWGQEARFQGSTWYFRAIPPQRLYNNWMGYEDTGIGGPKWEEENGRTCLPAMILHPIKEVKPTEAGYSSDSKLPYS
ncbi:hypothetical protein B0T16DRAFT_176589 [Cercophora newfieldiana]|uniref:Major facilitator superfamily transporter n=1 Tax=Cercophora newfieldiana TaxID=92897 RepID=A0AA39Y1C6_9PEZI|nr:hypothetical protein B0T16DRAFT_176589 [Cercophora newfieldiana]